MYTLTYIPTFSEYDSVSARDHQVNTDDQRESRTHLLHPLLHLCPLVGSLILPVNLTRSLELNIYHAE